MNGQSGGDIVGTGGLMTGDMKFVYRTDPDQMPVRRLIVQWGDGLASYNPGSPDTNSFPNRRGMKRDGISSMCDGDDTTPRNFGRSAEACVDRPFTMQHTYTCGGRESVGTAAARDCAPDGHPTTAQRDTGCWDANFISPAGRPGACIYIPRIHVKDNWGYCNGRCPNTGAAGAAAVTRLDGEKCFDGTGLGGGGAMEKDECNTLSVVQGLDPWTYFQGRVIVGPP